MGPSGLNRSGKRGRWEGPFGPTRARTGRPESSSARSTPPLSS